MAMLQGRPETLHAPFQKKGQLGNDGQSSSYAVAWRSWGIESVASEKSVVLNPPVRPSDPNVFRAYRTVHNRLPASSHQPPGIRPARLPCMSQV
jgi:hypothetical protein